MLSKSRPHILQQSLELMRLLPAPRSRRAGALESVGRAVHGAADLRVLRQLDKAVPVPARSLTARAPGLTTSAPSPSPCTRASTSAAALWVRRGCQSWQQAGHCDPMLAWALGVDACSQRRACTGSLALEGKFVIVQSLSKSTCVRQNPSLCPGSWQLSACQCMPLRACDPKSSMPVLLGYSVTHAQEHAA